MQNNHNGREVKIAPPALIFVYVCITLNYHGIMISIFICLNHKFTNTSNVPTDALTISSVLGFNVKHSTRKVADSSE